MQATAMGEALYLGFFIWALVYFAEFARGGVKADRSLIKCGLSLFAACLTRYDGWFLTAVLVLGAIVVSAKAPPFGSAQGKRLAKDARNGAPTILRTSRKTIAKFVLIAIAGPALWLAYNAAVYRNPLEFAQGPYSAKAIEQKTGTVNPAKGNLFAAGSYFLKA